MYNTQINYQADECEAVSFKLLKHHNSTNFEAIIPLLVDTAIAAIDASKKQGVVVKFRNGLHIEECATAG